MTVLRRELGASALARADGKTDREVNVIASTGTLDAHGEVIDPNGWDLRRYLANPVVLLAHDSGSLPIGTAKNVRVDNGKLRATVRIVDERAHPMAERVWQSIKQGALRGISVGLRPLERTTVPIAGRDVPLIKRAELVEISLVGIGSNPDALVERSLQRNEKGLHELTAAEHLAAYRNDRPRYLARLHAAMNGAKR